MWSNCAGRVELMRVTGADHCLKVSAGCTKSLESESGVQVRDVLVAFFVKNEN
jgi:hypothetical protein